MKPDPPFVIANPATVDPDQERMRDALGSTGILAPFTTARELPNYLDHLDKMARRRARTVQPAA